MRIRARHYQTAELIDLELAGDTITSVGPAK